MLLEATELSSDPIGGSIKAQIVDEALNEATNRFVSSKRITE